MAFIIVCCVIGLVCLVISEDFLDWFFFTMFASIGAALFFGLFGYWSSSKSQKTNQPIAQSAPPQQPATPPPASQPSPQQQNTTPPQTQKEDFPRDWPGNDATQAEKDKWWHDWAEYEIRGAPIVCKDGVQIVVFGDIDGNSNTTDMTAYVRVHPDGKPYTCAESTDPAKESQS